MRAKLNSELQQDKACFASVEYRDWLAYKTFCILRWNLDEQIHYWNCSLHLAINRCDLAITLHIKCCSGQLTDP